MNRFRCVALLLVSSLALGCERSQLSDLEVAADDHSTNNALLQKSQAERDAWLETTLARTESAGAAQSLPPETEPPIEPSPEHFEPSEPVVENTVPTDNVATEPPAVSPPRRTPSTSTTTQQSQQPPVRLRAGVALPQTGPEGILMSFSVDYEFVNGQPSTGSKYRWVIKGSGDRGGALDVKLQKSGNLAVLINGWRPGEGPYESWLEEMPASGDPRVLSYPERMR